MSTRDKRLGDWGEQKAAQHLLEKGYQIVARNFRWARGEIDIVAQKANMLVFVEVKTASSINMGDPSTWVTPKKQSQIAQVAQKFLFDYAITDQDCRFDVIGVLKTAASYRLQHIENAFWLHQNE